MPETLDPYLAHIHEHEIDVNVQDYQHNTPLSLVAKHGNQSAVELLLKCGALPNFEKSTPLIEAIKGKYYEIARILIQAGVDVNRKDDQEVPTLHHAVETGKHNFVQLLADAGVDVQATNRKRQTALHLALERTKHQTNATLRIERILLRHGADINAVDILGMQMGIKDVFILMISRPNCSPHRIHSFE